MTFHVRDRVTHPSVDGVLVVVDIDLTSTTDTIYTVPEYDLERFHSVWREQTPNQLREWCWDHRDDDIVKESHPAELDLYAAGNWIDRGEFVHCNNCHANLDTVREWATHFATECDHDR